MTGRVVLLALALGQLLVPPLLFASGFQDNAAKLPMQVEPNPATPAAYAFSIWGAIFLGSLAFAIFGVTRAGRDDQLVSRIARRVAVGFGLCWLWLFAARFGPLWATVPVIIAMLVALGGAYVTVMRSLEPKSTVQQWAVAAPLGLYAGWLTAAVFANSGDVLPGYGFDRFGLSAEQFGLLLVSGAAVTAIAIVSIARPHPAYLLAVIWALGAIAVRNGGPATANIVALAAILACVALLLFTAIRWLVAGRDRLTGAAS